MFDYSLMINDEGSQLSYITNDLLKKVGANALQSEWSRNMLFSGVVTEPRKVNAHELEICKIDGSESMKIILQETPNICGIIPRVCDGPWLNELRQNGIELSDVSFAHDEKAPVVSVQIGSDYRDSLIVSAPQPLRNGLSVTKTKFGWSVAGSVPDTVQVNSCFEIPTSLACFNQEKTYQLWELDALGIKINENDGENKLVQEIFENTVTRADDGRYCVSLPWKEPPENLPTNRPVAEKRLRNLSKRLISNSMYSEYNRVLTQWKNEDIIGEVPEKTSCVHFLPH